MVMIFIKPWPSTKIMKFMTIGSVVQDLWVGPIWPHTKSVLNFIIFSSVLSLSWKVNLIHCYYVHCVHCCINHKLCNSLSMGWMEVFLLGEERVMNVTV